MACDEPIDTSPRVLPVNLAGQLLPGTFEHAAHHRLAHAVDLSRADARCRNDATGASAYLPRMLLAVVLRAYAYGVVSSRGIERLCREHVTFIAHSRGTLHTADAGYHSETDRRALAEQGLDALIADTCMRRRDARFATPNPHREAPHPLRELTGGRPEPRAFQPADFTYDADARTCVSPAGHSLHRTGKNTVTRGCVADHFRRA